MGEEQPPLPLNPPIYSHQTLTQISESFTREQLQAQALPSTTGHSHSAHLCPLSITSSCNSYERAMPTRSSSHTALP